jgi:hypothetical protein
MIGSAAASDWIRPKADMQHINSVAGKESFELTVRAAILPFGCGQIDPAISMTLSARRKPAAVSQREKTAIHGNYDIV